MEHIDKLAIFFKLVPPEGKFQAIDRNGASIISNRSQNLASRRQADTGRVGSGGERRRSARRPSEVIHLPLYTLLRGPRAGMALSVTQHVTRYFRD